MDVEEVVNVTTSVVDVMTSSVTSESVNSNSSDTESWTILEDEDAVDSIIYARVDVNLPETVVAFTTKHEEFQVQNHDLALLHQETDSDIETLDNHHDHGNEETNKEESEELVVEVGSQYSILNATSSSSATQTTILDDDNDDELEIIDVLDENVAKTQNYTDSLCPSGYPPEELMEGFPKVCFEKITIFCVNWYFKMTLDSL
jgi:hypothetical protein